jgi:hypothetical protein
MQLHPLLTSSKFSYSVSKVVVYKLFILIEARTVTMSTRKYIERKSTFTSTTCREVDLHREAKTPPNRITSMKSLSF